MILPPDYLDQWPDGQRAFRRITDKLLARGEWDALYLSSAATAALSCACYRRACEAYGPRDALTLETHDIARAWLVEMKYLRPAAAARFDDAGDRDLLELCAE